MCWSLDWHRLLPLTSLLLLMVGHSGCVLSGGLHGVGGQLVNGRLLDSDGNGIANQRLVLLQGHFDRLDTETAQYVTAPADVWKLERVELITDAEGHFSHQLHGFTHCHPMWIIPPLGSLPSKLTGDTEHGKFFILQTPGNQGGIYEVRLKDEGAVVKKWSNEHNRKQRIDPKIEPENITATLRTIEKQSGNDHVWMIPEITIEIVRRR